MIRAADEAGAALTVITLRTPGGLVDSTLEINEAMLAARVPVVVWVGPSGSRAASAGFLITIAADVVAMAPGTHIGAAHPVSGGAPLDETMAQKSAEDVAAHARSLAERRGRNVKLAEEAVFDSRSFTANEAIDASPPLADLMASDLDDLLAKLDGYTVRRFDEREVTLHTAGAEIVFVPMTWRQRLLSGIAHPQVAYLLFSLGTLGLTIELWNPGAIVPGVVGGLCLLLAFFAFQILPVNYAGLLLILFGLLLLVLEIKVAGFGLLAVGGVTSLIFGSLMLFDSPVPGLRLGLGFVLPLVLAFSAIVLFLVRLAVKAQRRRAATGEAGMVDELGVALGGIEPGTTGRVAVHGEIWNATSDEPIAKGDEVRVVSVRGLKITVRRTRPLTTSQGEE
jgi:membrane-bound serine protease (ClpP class)